VSRTVVQVRRRYFVALIIVVLLVPFETALSAAAVWQVRNLVDSEEREEELEEERACEVARETREEREELDRRLYPSGMQREVVDDYYASLPPPSACVQR
jgi:hypothetical protein